MALEIDGAWSPEGNGNLVLELNSNKTGQTIASGIPIWMFTWSYDENTNELIFIDEVGESNDYVYSSDKDSIVDIPSGAQYIRISK